MNQAHMENQERINTLKYKGTITLTEIPVQ